VRGVSACCALVALASAARGAEPAVPRATEPFDVRTAQRYLGIGVARLSVRPTDATHYRPGFELRVLDGLVWTHRWATLGGGVGGSLRSLPDGYALSIGQSNAFAGVRLGPVDVLGGVGVSLLNLDALGGGWSVSLASPRTFAGLALHVGPVRVDALAQLEYLWRWAGTDQYVRGLGVMISLLRPAIGPDFR
jgi:hypothetical protein